MTSSDSSSEDDKRTKYRRSRSPVRRRHDKHRRYVHRDNVSPHDFRRHKRHASTREYRKHRETENRDEPRRERMNKLADNETMNRNADRAKEKLSVLAKLGIELKLPEQDKKRKLWTSDKCSGSGSAWKAASFEDGKLTAKFQRLMGIKGSEGAPTSSSSNMQDQEKFLQIMEAQYEVARQTTHSLRGAGLGFAK